MDEVLSMVIYFNNKYVTCGGEGTPSGRCYGKILFSLSDEIFSFCGGSSNMRPENVRPVIKEGKKNEKVFGKGL